LLGVQEVPGSNPGGPTNQSATYEPSERLYAIDEGRPARSRSLQKHNVEIGETVSLSPQHFHLGVGEL